MHTVIRTSRRMGLSAVFVATILATACVPGTGETTKDLAVEAVQDVLTNPLGHGAPLAGVVLGIDKLGMEGVRREYEARAVRAQQLANDAQGNPTLQSQYEKEADLYSAARDCLVTRDCDELNKLQKELRTDALKKQASQGGNGGGGGGGHTD